MARNLCLTCQRPLNACICAFIDNINNKTPVLVLQHPSEVQQSKGTVALLQRSLNSCQVIVGEDFSDNVELNRLLQHYQALLLYPSEKSQVITLTDSHNHSPLSTSRCHEKSQLLIIIDGTWKKAYKMLMLSRNLHTLTHICLPDFLANNGQYLIRKVAKKKALSSLEATCYALALLDGELIQDEQAIDCGCYQSLLNKFTQFNQFQLSFRK